MSSIEDLFIETTLFDGFIYGPIEDDGFLASGSDFQNWRSFVSSWSSDDTPNDRASNTTSPQSSSYSLPPPLPYRPYPGALHYPSGDPSTPLLLPPDPTPHLLLPLDPPPHLLLALSPPLPPPRRYLSGFAKALNTLMNLYKCHAKRFVRRSPRQSPLPAGNISTSISDNRSSLPTTDAARPRRKQRSWGKASSKAFIFVGWEVDFEEHHLISMRRISATSLGSNGEEFIVRKGQGEMKMGGRISKFEVQGPAHAVEDEGAKWVLKDGDVKGRKVWWVS